MMFCHTIKNKKSCLSLLLLSVLSGCATDSAISTQVKALSTPDIWATDEVSQGISEHLMSDWLGISNDQHLQQIIELALNNNFNLNAAALDVKIAQERLNVSEATNFPELTMAVNQQRAKFVDGDNESFNNNAELSLRVEYELDLWGKLSDEQQQAELSLASVKSTYEHQRIVLITEVTQAWFDLLESETLLRLYQERASNLQNNLEIIDGSYRLGLNSALDVYLAQNDMNAELARVEGQKQRVVERKRTLQTIVGHYPSGDDPNLQQPKEWPVLSHTMYAALPASLMTNRADIRSSWYDLMSADAGLAVAHKQRFPQFTLSASTGDSSNELSNLLSGNALAWSLFGNITTPLFNAGKLESLEQQARLTVQKKEQRYLELVYNAFAEVENKLSNHGALNKQLLFSKQAEKNALAAQTLSFSQYQKGLVTYTTVLESQRRAFDTQTSVIQLESQLIQNRILVYAALGGEQLEEALHLSKNKNDLAQVNRSLDVEMNNDQK